MRFFVVGDIFELVIQGTGEAGVGETFKGPFGESLLVEGILKVLELVFVSMEFGVVPSEVMVLTYC